MSAYLVAAYIVFWSFTFVFVLSLWARQRAIRRDLERLEERLQSSTSSGD